MLVTHAQVKLFKSIDDSDSVTIDNYTTVLVGQNESGKTAFLQALYKAKAVDSDVGYVVLEDYPRKGLNEYLKRHNEDPAIVAELTYQLQENEIEEINRHFGFKLLQEFSFKRHCKYNGSSTIIITVPEMPYIQHLISGAKLPSEIATKASQAKTIRQLISILDGLDLNTEAKSFLEALKLRFGPTEGSWNDLLDHYIWKRFLFPKIPKFLYFDDYYLLPGKINLPALQQRVQTSLQNKQPLENEDKTVLSLLQMADVDLEDLVGTTGYESVKAKLEGISNSITDKVFEYWTQNRELDVEFDIRTDPNDQAPYNSGNNLYIRIRNRRHRVSVPFSQRSKGFIWFFSFIVWFDSIKQQIGANTDLILLLDEPGLSLHALAQADFLKYIDDLARNHQIIYTTHSPFMVHSDRLHQVRTVEDRVGEGTKISENITGSDPNTLFPLQAALGYTIAQNLFISKRNLIVEGPADLIYLRFFSSILTTRNRMGLRDDITIVPVGGLDKLATFVALLRGNELQMAVLHDYSSKPDARLESLVRQKLIRDKQVLNYAMFRNSVKSATKAKSSTSINMVSTDVEDMFSPELYLKLFSNAYKKQLSGIEVKESDLPAGDRIVERIERYLVDKGIQLRASGGYNHYLVASYLASNPVPVNKISADTLNRFEQLFLTVNSLFLE
jgi:hypothetical protein